MCRTVHRDGVLVAERFFLPLASSVLDVKRDFGANLVNEFMARKNLSIFNLKIYQEREFYPVAVEVLKNARMQLNR